jgi:putative oxidoreductase
MDFLRPWSEQIYAALRIVVGFLFLCHGVQKLMMGAPPEQMPAALFWAAALIESVGGALVMLGFFAGAAAFIASGTMAAAYFVAHHYWLSKGLAGWLPIENKGELAVLYCFAFLFIASKGSGIWSVDAVRRAS